MKKVKILKQVDPTTPLEALNAVLAYHLGGTKDDPELLRRCKLGNKILDEGLADARANAAKMRVALKVSRLKKRAEKLERIKSGVR